MIFQTFPNEIDLTPPKRVKFGIDPTLDRLHLGHFVPLRLVKQLQQVGHHVTIVLGTFTAQLGDPSGREKTRPILTEEEVHHNAVKIEMQVRKILGERSDSQGNTRWQVFYNNDVFGKMTVPDVMKLAAEFTAQQMLVRDSFQKRLESQQPLGLHELLVPILQAWDSVVLKTEIEVGGQDQLFNFKIARQLQAAYKLPPQGCIMTPIINGTDGRKMSKSLGNCVYLDEHPNDIYGKVMSISDLVMDEWFPLLSDRPKEKHPMATKKSLAFDIVSQIHGGAAAEDAQDYFEQTIQAGKLPDEIPEILASTLTAAVAIIRTSSKSAARKLMEGGGVYIDGVRTTEDCTLSPGQIVRVGGRSFGKISG